jgi:pimeloyl-ACP methyl ester carboxylesterase
MGAMSSAPLLWTLVLVVLAIALAGRIYQRRGISMDARRSPPPGQLVELGHGRRLHFHCLGAGRPSVIFEAGIAASSLSWTHVQPRVAEFARACSYDRAGLAWSDAGPRCITATTCASDLHDLLSRVAVPPPYVLVGHSYGAFVLHAYATRHPATVAGLVLVDPIFPAEWMNMTRRERLRLRGGVFLSKVGALVAGVGGVRACLALLARGSTRVPRSVSRAFGSEAAHVLHRLVGEVQKLPRDAWPAVQAHWSQTKCFMSMADHLDGLRKSAVEIAACGDLPASIPIAVLTGATQPRAYHDEHARMATRAARGRHIVARGSGHWILLDEPDLVVDAIRWVVGETQLAGVPRTWRSHSA